jgi:Phospholipase_D-nuclease N-terminal
MLRLFGFEALALLFLVFWVWGLIDCIATESARVRNLPKLAWVVIIIVLSALGALVWLLLGRPEGGGLMPGGRSAPAGGRPALRSRPRDPDPRTLYPDDHPVSDRRSAELDRQLDEILRRRAAETGAREPAPDDVRRRDLEAWEAELAARERELKRREREPGGDGAGP